jgi:aspartyl-tRNA(Asn)/glutamyl-tRNA(Gln) amidotransferase subunit A
LTDIAEIAVRTAIEIAFAYRNGETSPIALTEYLLERIEKAERDNIFITVTPARARKEAEAAEARYRRRRPLSVLDGVPIAWKDLFDVADYRRLSPVQRKTPKEHDLVCVANAAAAGMVCMGKLNLSELAYSGLGLNPHFGTPVNPNDRNTHRSPGGSSSGSGAAVAAGLVPCAVGTDTGGSVRIPASFNGVFGFKTSEGRIDKTGVIPLSRTFDTIGPLARSVADCAALAGPLPSTPSGATSADLNSSCRKTWFATRRNRRSWRISSARWTRSDEPAQPSLGVRSMQSTRLPT